MLFIDYESEIKIPIIEEKHAQNSPNAQMQSPNGLPVSLYSLNPLRIPIMHNTCPMMANSHANTKPMIPIITEGVTFMFGVFFAAGGIVGCLKASSCGTL